MTYDAFLFLYLFFLIPVLFYKRLKGKKYPDLLKRLGFFLPKNLQKGGIWIHAVSVGEIKAVAPLFRLLKQEYPETFFTVTTTTSTGLAEAKRSLKGMDAYLYSPIDFSFVVRRFIKKLQPYMFLISEGDFWPQLIKKLNCKIFLVSGKVSKKTASRWQIFPKFAKDLFAPFDLLCVQNEEYAKRFFPFAGDKVKVTGNLKLDIEPEKVENVKLSAGLSYITMSSTHAGEEERLLDLFDGPWRVLLAPRHPERFDTVESLLKKKGISYTRFSKTGWKLTSEKVLLMDSMGELGTCYVNSLLAIVGGSFIPGVGGHNVLEPCLYGCPVIFGPYTFAQKELTQKVLDAHAGCASSFETLFKDVQQILYARDAYSERSLELVKQLRGATFTTWKEISMAIKQDLK